MEALSLLPFLYLLARELMNVARMAVTMNVTSAVKKMALRRG